MTRLDPGLQPERTELAWRRTLLTLCVGSLVAVRALPPVFGGAAVVAAVGGLVAGAALWVGAGRRSRAVAAALSSEPGTMPGGRLLAAAAGVVAVGAALGLVAVVLRIVGPG